MDPLHESAGSQSRTSLTVVIDPVLRESVLVARVQRDSVHGILRDVVGTRGDPRGIAQCETREIAREIVFLRWWFANCLIPEIPSREL